MRCVNCGVDITGSKGKGFPSSCPSCGHKTVTRPRESGFADRQIQMAIDRVSAEDTVYFLREHVVWEFLRVLGRRAEPKNVGLKLAGFGVSIVLIIGLMASDQILLGLILTFVVLMVFVVAGAKRYLHGKYPDLMELVDAFEAVNPSPWLIKAGRHMADRDRVEGQPDPVATGRVLVCDHQAYVEFYQANDFEMHAACAVIHGSDRPSGRDRDVVAQLKRMPQADVFLVHDLTPRGLALAGRIRDSSHWFAGRSNVTVRDLGITGNQLDILDGQWRPLANIPGSGDAGMVIEGLPGGLGTELTVFRPHHLLNMTLLCIDQRRPFHEVDRRRAGDDGAVAGGG